MKIEDQVGCVIVQVGFTSKNRVRFSPSDPSLAVELSLSQWKDMKILVDKMFKVAEEMSTP